MSGMGMLLCMCDRGAIEFFLHPQWSNVGSTSWSIYSKRDPPSFPPRSYGSKRNVNRPKACQMALK
jgi:hypothetical protein